MDGDDTLLEIEWNHGYNASDDYTLTSLSRNILRREKCDWRRGKLTGGKKATETGHISPIFQMKM